MNTTTILNPKTNRSVRVRYWEVESKEIGARFHDGTFKSVKDLSWALLSEKHVVKEIERTEAGDSADTNFALGIFENALDWSLGLAVVRFIKDACAQRKCPRTFKVAASRSGDVFIVCKGKTREVVFKY